MDDMHSGSRRVIACRLKNHAAQVNKLVKELKPPLPLVPLDSSLHPDLQEASAGKQETCGQNQVNGR